MKLSFNAIHDLTFFDDAQYRFAKTQINYVCKELSTFKKDYIYYFSTVEDHEACSKLDELFGLKSSNVWTDPETFDELHTRELIIDEHKSFKIIHGYSSSFEFFYITKKDLESLFTIEYSEIRTVDWI